MALEMRLSPAVAVGSLLLRGPVFTVYFTVFVHAPSCGRAEAVAAVPADLPFGAVCVTPLRRPARKMWELYTPCPLFLSSVISLSAILSPCTLKTALVVPFLLRSPKGLHNWRKGLPVSLCLHFWRFGLEEFL